MAFGTWRGKPPPTPNNGTPFHVVNGVAAEDGGGRGGPQPGPTRLPEGLQPLQQRPGVGVRGAGVTSVRWMAAKLLSVG